MTHVTRAIDRANFYDTIAGSDMGTSDETAKLTCPCCQATLVVDRDTMGILYTDEHREKAGGTSFNQALGGTQGQGAEKEQLVSAGGGGGKTTPCACWVKNSSSCKKKPPKSRMRPYRHGPLSWIRQRLRPLPIWLPVACIRSLVGTPGRCGRHSGILMASSAIPWCAQLARVLVGIVL